MAMHDHTQATTLNRLSPLCSHYALHNISSQSRTTTIYAFQTLSYISEGAIFLYCGMDTLDPIKWQVSQGIMWGCCRWVAMQLEILDE